MLRWTHPRERVAWNTQVEQCFEVQLEGPLDTCQKSMDPQDILHRFGIFVEGEPGIGSRDWEPKNI